MSEPILRTEALKKDFHDGQRTLQVLRGVDFGIEPGEAVAIVGPSGSGKSTLLNLLGALDRPSGGRVLLEGQDLTKLRARALDRVRRDRIGLVFQFHYLMPELRAWENVALPARIARRLSGQARRRAMELIERVGLSERADHPPLKLSGGEQQRVALARALMNDPAVVLADEPTGNLDQAMGRQVIDLLWEMTTGRDRSLVIVTHEPEIAARADRILHLEKGHLRRES